MAIVGTAESLFRMRLYAICCTGTFCPHYLMANPPALHSFCGFGALVTDPLEPWDHKKKGGGKINHVKEKRHAMFSEKVAERVGQN